MAKKKRKKGHYQTGRTSKKADKRVKAKHPGKRQSRAGSLYYERRKNRSDMPGTMLGIKLKKMPKRPKSKASTGTLENFVKKARDVEKENNKRIALAKQIKKITGK